MYPTTHSMKHAWLDNVSCVTWLIVPFVLWVVGHILVHQIKIYLDSILAIENYKNTY